MKKVRIIKDFDVIFRDWNDEFDHSKMTLKKNLIINVEDDQAKIYEDIPWSCEFERFIHIQFCAWEYDRNLIEISIIQESEDDINDVEELRDIECGIYIDADYLEEVE